MRSMMRKMMVLGLLLVSLFSVRLFGASEPEALADFEVMAESAKYVVQGTVKTYKGIPSSGLIIRAFDKRISKLIFLGETVTDSSGRYRINYSDTSFRDKNSPNLVVRALNKKNNILAESGVIMKANPVETVNLTLVAPPR